MSQLLPSVVIVDDHELFRAGVRAELEGLVEVRSEAGGVEEAVAAIRAAKPDVVLLDVHLPDVSGLTVARRLVDGDAAPSVVLISSRDAGDYTEIVPATGALGFVPKAELSTEAISALLP
jgi:DNA-binding NarL/FixJ family response regulator